MPETMKKRTLKDIKGWIIDMDGVLYHDTVRLSGAAEFLSFLTQEGTKFVLLTNNSTKTPEQYVEKLAVMGIHVPQEQVLTSGMAAADYLKANARAGAPVFVIGEDGVTEAVLAAGLVLTQDPQEAEYVIVGMDYSLNYDKLEKATLAIRRGARFIGTNPDRTLPTPKGLVPGNGAILAALQTATDVEPTIIGKPRPHILRWALSRLQLNAAETACLGDRLETDILGGHEIGLHAVLVLSGVSSKEDLLHFQPKPDAVYADVAALLCAWQHRLD